MNIMEHYESIEKGIAECDVKKLRTAIASISYTCRDFSDGEFDKVVKYVESKGIKLKDDQLVGNPTISSQKNVYTEDDFTRAVYELKKNFCDERIEDVKKIGKSLYGNRKEKVVKQAPDIQEKSNRIYPKVQDHQNEKNKIMFAVLVVIIIVILIICILALQKK